MLLSRADLNPLAAPASRTYATIGTAPNRQFILRYSQVPLYGTIADLPLTCDVLLSEGSNQIEVRYYQVPAFLSTTSYVDVGIQNSVSGGLYDYVSLLSVVNPTPFTAYALTGLSLFFTPITPFTNPGYFQLAPPVPTTTSAIYSASLAPLPPLVAFTPTATLPYTADAVALIFIGFNFTFFNVTYNEVVIGANGNIQFATVSTASYAFALGSTSNSGLSPFVAFFYTDLNPAAAPATRTYATIGTAPNRQFIVRYSQVPTSFLSEGTLSCDVLLYETTNQIEFRYYQVPLVFTTNNVDIGIQGPLSGGVYDSVAIVSATNLLLNLALPLNGSDYIFTPRTPFTNALPETANVTPKPVTSTSTVYTAALGVAPAPVAFTPTGSLSLVDDGTDAVQLGFSFVFYNTSYQTAYISSNGNIQFNSATGTSGSYAFGSQDAALTPFIAFFYTDLVPTNAGSRTYATIGTAPNRVFILRNTAVPVSQNIGSGVVSCDVLLYEGTNAIEFRYYTLPVTTYYPYITIGVQNSVANNAYDYVSILNAQALSAFLGPALTNTSYVITPLVPFTNPRTFSPTPAPASSSTVYSALYYNGLPTPVSFTPAGTLPSDDNGVVSVPLGFTFAFYGVAYSSVFVGSNGDIQFQTELEDYTVSTFGSGVGFLSPFIAFFYTDLDPALGGTRTYATIGSAPNRQFILRYSNVPTQAGASSGSNLTCDVILTESSNTIEFRYYAVPLIPFVAVDIGIEGGVGSSGSNDWISVVNDKAVISILVSGLTQAGYIFTPITPFTGALPYAPLAPTIKSSSTVYAVTTSAVPAMVDLGAGATALPVFADAVARINLGFDFTFYGTSYTAVFPGANGNLQFATGASTSIPVAFESINYGLGPFVSFFFTDLAPTATKSYSIIGQAPNRQLVIRYSAVTFQIAPTVPAVTCDIILTETANTIELRYYSVSPTPFASTIILIGLTSGTSSEFISIVDAGGLSAPAAKGLQGNSYLFSPISRFQANPPVFVANSFNIVDNSASYYAQIVPSVVPQVSFTPGSPDLSLTDDGIDFGIALGFNFVFYGVSYSAVNVGANGDLQFVTTNTGYSPGVFGSADASLAPFIAFFWSAPASNPVQLESVKATKRNN